MTRDSVSSEVGPFPCSLGSSSRIIAVEDHARRRPCTECTVSTEGSIQSTSAEGRSAASVPPPTQDREFDISSGYDVNGARDWYPQLRDLEYRMSIPTFTGGWTSRTTSIRKPLTGRS